MQRPRGRRSDNIYWKERQEFRVVFERAPMGAYWVSPQGRILEVNPTLARMLGFESASELRGQSIEEFRSAIGYSWQDFHRRVAAGGRVHGLEALWTRRDGTSLIAKENAWTVNGPDGELRYIEGTVMDVTGRKTSEALATFRTVLEGLPIGFAQIDRDGRLGQTNAAFQKMVGYADYELDGLAYADLTHPEDAEADAARFRSLLSGSQRFFVTEKRYRRKDGSAMWVQETVSLMPDAQYATAVVEDITDRKRAEEHVRQRTAELEGANRELESFAYTVSHDLRQPLRSIEGFTSLLLEEHGARLDKDARMLFERIRRAVCRMAQLIDSLLMLSRVTRTELDRRRVDLSALARAVARDLRQRESRRRCRFVIQPGLKAEADPKLIRIVLENLFANAWKFSATKDRARVEFGAARDGGRTVFHVRDNGVGFDMAYVNKLFQPFQRLHNPDQFEGTGIGLATVQRILQRHGGRIWARARKGRGATFYFTI